jgi:hypothetical protein
MMRNFNTSPRTLAASTTLIGALLLSACGGSHEDVTSPNHVATNPLEMAKQRGVNIAQLFDGEYATKDCLTNTPYDPIRTDGKPEASVRMNEQYWGYMRVSPSGGNANSDLLLEVKNGELIPYRLSQDTFDGYINCPHSE